MIVGCTPCITTTATTATTTTITTTTTTTTNNNNNILFYNLTLCNGFTNEQCRSSVSLMFPQFSYQ